MGVTHSGLERIHPFGGLLFLKLKQRTVLALALIAGSTALACTKPADGEPAAGSGTAGRTGGARGGRGGPALDRPAAGGYTGTVIKLRGMGMKMKTQAGL